MIPLAVKAIKEGFRISSYTPRSGRHRSGQLLGGTGAATAQAAPGETTFVDAVQLAINTIMPNDFSSWDTIDELVQ